VVVLAVAAFAAEHKSAEGRDKRGALLAYDYAYPYYAAPYAYSPYYSAAYVASPYARSAYVAAPYTAAYTSAYYYK
jgi:hypothetical protein